MGEYLEPRGPLPTDGERAATIAADLGRRLLAEEGSEMMWSLEARCLDADPEAFFPEKGGSTREAKRICGICPVQSECLDYALENDQRSGIWGGLSERERRRLKRASRRVA